MTRTKAAERWLETHLELGGGAHLQVAQADEWVERFGGDRRQLLRNLVPLATRFAHAARSSFRVGCAASGQSGAVYLGANLELPGLPLSTAVHAEQAAVWNAIAHGESGVDELAVGAPPCGHCRQFLLELGDPSALDILLPEDEPTSLAQLVPRPFAPRELGIAASPFRSGESSQPLPASLVGSLDAVARHAAAAAAASHAPYSGSRSGAALELGDGSIVTGRTIESVAYNPTLPALQAALSSLLMAGQGPERVLRAALCVVGDEPDRFHASARAALEALCPQASLQVLIASP